MKKRLATRALAAAPRSAAIERAAARRPAAHTTAAQHAEATRHRLLEAAAVVLARGGFERAKVAVIAREAGVANGTFYLHFPTKSAVAAELARIATGDLARRLAEVHAATPDPEEANRAEIEALVDFVLANRSLVVALLSVEEVEDVALLDLLAKQRESEIRAAQRDGSYVASVDAAVAARAEVALLSGVLRWWARSGFAVERRVVVDSLSRLRRDGSRPRE